MHSVIIGSNGLIAPVLIKSLKKLGHQVTALHHNDKIDIKDAEYIFYVASYGNQYHQKEPELIMKANVLDYITLLKATRNIAYKALIYFSTSSVSLPIQTDYSESKSIGEVLSRGAAKKYMKSIISVRPYSVYGEGEADNRFFPTLIRHSKSGEPMPFSDGWHDWIYVQDFVDALILVVQNAPKFIGKVVQIGTGKQTSNQEIVDMMNIISGGNLHKVESKEAKRPYDTQNWVADVTSLKALGWEPKYTVYEGLSKMYEK